MSTSDSAHDANATASVGRTLILCFDGTLAEYDADNTNVVKFYALLRKDDENQLCYYQAGVGTWFDPGVVSPIFEWAAKVLDQAFAWYLDSHVMNGYKFLMQNYRAGDKICIFGFSRGAYVARALGGFLHKVGLLPRDNPGQVPFAYKMYKRTDAAGLKLCAGFKETYCQTVQIEFMGVWDTVSSVGVLAGRTLPYTNSNISIKTFRHALSLDERRAKFRPNNYYRPDIAKPAYLSADPDTSLNGKDSGEHTGTSDHSTSSSSSGAKTSPTAENGKKKAKWQFFGKSPLKGKGKEKSNSACWDNLGSNTDVLEVWFSGCHSDVGGGAVLNETPNAMGNISLRWMVRQVLAASCGIKFDIPALMRARLDLSPEPSQAEIELDLVDALQPLHDPLRRSPLWWPLEVIPLTWSWQDPEGEWHRELGINFGRGRKLYDQRPKFHATVKRRMEDPTLKYTPKARYTPGSEVYVH